MMDTGASWMIRSQLVESGPWALIQADITGVDAPDKGFPASFDRVFAGRASEFPALAGKKRRIHP